MEHLHHFNLSQDPFQNEPDLRFFFPSETHRRAQLRVDRALRQSKGLVVLVGEGGTGKSLLARSMFEELEEEMFESSLLVMMQGTADANSVLRRFCAQLGLEDPPSELVGPERHAIGHAPRRSVPIWCWATTNGRSAGALSSGRKMSS